MVLLAHHGRKVCDLLELAAGLVLALLLVTVRFLVTIRFLVFGLVTLFATTRLRFTRPGAAFFALTGLVLRFFRIGLALCLVFLKIGRALLRNFGRTLLKTGRARGDLGRLAR